MEKTEVVIHNQTFTEDELIIPCHGCGGGDHIAVFTTYPDDLNDKLYIYTYLSSEFRRPHGLVDRIKSAWHIFWKGEYSSADVGLNKDDLVAIRGWCDKLLKLEAEGVKEIVVG